jgi:hypothetical protein
LLPPKIRRDYGQDVAEGRRRVSASVATRRMTALLLGTLAAIAFLLALAGSMECCRIQSPAGPARSACGWFSARRRRSPPGDVELQPNDPATQLSATGFQLPAAS